MLMPMQGCCRACSILASCRNSEKFFMASVARRCLSMVSVGDNSHWSPREDKGWLDPGVGWVGRGPATLRAAIQGLDQRGQVVSGPEGWHCGLIPRPSSRANMVYLAPQWRTATCPHPHHPQRALVATWGSHYVLFLLHPWCVTGSLAHEMSRMYEAPPSPPSGRLRIWSPRSPYSLPSS
jgi:hypothetical protein